MCPRKCGRSSRKSNFYLGELVYANNPFRIFPVWSKLPLGLPRSRYLMRTIISGFQLNWIKEIFHLFLFGIFFHYESNIATLYRIWEIYRENKIPIIPCLKESKASAWTDVAEVFFSYRLHVPVLSAGWVHVPICLGHSQVTSVSRHGN